MRGVKKINELPPEWKSWGELLRFCLRQNPSIMEDPQFKIIRVDLPITGSFGNSIYYDVDRDFLKARVFDEMWKDMDIDYGLIRRVQLDMKFMETSYTVLIDENLNKVLQIANVRKL